MKRIASLLMAVIIFLHILGGPVWAAYPSSGAQANVTASAPQSQDTGFLNQIWNGVQEVKNSVTSVVDFFRNFDPGQIINDWIKKSLTDFLRPTLTWAEKNTAQYPYLTHTDPQFTWWETLVVLALGLMLFAALRMAGQVMKGQRTSGDIVIVFGLFIWLFLSVWITNLLVYARNHITYAFMDWMIKQHWLTTDALQSTAQFIVPDLAKAIMANQDAVSAILAFILGGFIMFLFELFQFFVYGSWVLLVVGTPVFTTMTTWGSDFTPFMSLISGLVRTLIASIVIAISWGIQGYVYTSQTDTTLQIILQAVVVVITVLVLWMFWGKFIVTEIFGMLSQPVQTVKGNLTSKAGSSMQTAGKAASILGALTGNPALAAMGLKAKTAGDVLSEEGEKIKVQASRPPARHHDFFSRMVENSFGRENAAGAERSTGDFGSLKTTFKGPFTKPPSLHVEPSGHSIDSHLDHFEERLIPEEVGQYFKPVSTPGGGTFFKYDGPMADELAEQLREKGVPVHEIDNSVAVDLPHEKIAKRLAARNLRGRTLYWEKDGLFITVDAYGVTSQHVNPPRNGINMGPWKLKKGELETPDVDSEDKE